MTDKIFSKDELVQIRHQLPRGYARILQSAVKKTNGKKYNLDSIRRGLMYEYQSERIIKAAIHLIENSDQEIKKAKVTLNNW
jgi:hypothetical protein